jgi:hypothetical protein
MTKSRSQSKESPSDNTNAEAGFEWNWGEFVCDPRDFAILAMEVRKTAWEEEPIDLTSWRQKCVRPSGS